MIAMERQPGQKRRSADPRRFSPYIETQASFSFVRNCIKGGGGHTTGRARAQWFGLRRV